MRRYATPEHLPYVDELISVLIVDESAGLQVAESELERVLFFNRPLIRGSGTHWMAQTATMPNDVGEWTHGLINEQRWPVSKDARLGPWVNGMRWMVGDLDVTTRSGDKKRNDRYESRSSRGGFGMRLVDGVNIAVAFEGSGKKCRHLPACL